MRTMTNRPREKPVGYRILAVERCTQFGESGGRGFGQRLKAAALT